jgi:hypothetical protein
MTLPNFDWTDKDSVKWFIMLPTGHLGPYSLNSLERMRLEKRVAPTVKIWAEGLTEPVTLKKALEFDEMGELPPIPEDEIPPLPFDTEERSDPSLSSEIPEVPEQEVEEGKKAVKIPVWGFVSLAVLLVVFFALGSIIKNSENFEVARLPKMSVELHKRVLAENQFGGWDKKIFFKEYLPQDHSQIWLVTSSYQTCQVEAIFRSIKDKLLTNTDAQVDFKSVGKLENHVVEFSSIDFLVGNKIIPGLYEMDVKANDCKWDSLFALIMNKFSGPDDDYMARTKVVLFAAGAEEFNKVLDDVVKNKIAKALKEQSQNEIFWQDLQQKLETLQAITLQIEQHLLDCLDSEPAGFTKNRKPMVEKYTRQFGSFLTSFVVENENYFKNLNSEARGASQKRNYELMVKLTSKRIGLETMQYIEEFQGLKINPTKPQLVKYSERVKNTFINIKRDIGQKIIQVSEDRSK